MTIKVDHTAGITIGQMTTIHFGPEVDDARVIEGGRSWELEDAMRHGYIPIATWLDPGKIDLDRRDEDRKVVESNEVIAPVRTWVLARRTERTHEALRLQLAAAEKTASDLQSKQWKHEQELRDAKLATETAGQAAATATIQRMQEQLNRYELHMGAVRESIGSARFAEITKAADENRDQPF